MKIVEKSGYVKTIPIPVDSNPYLESNTLIFFTLSVLTQYKKYISSGEQS